MPPRKRGGNPEEAGIPPRLKKDGYLPEATFCVSGGYPKKLTKGEKRAPPEDLLLKKGKGGTLPSYAAVTRGQTAQKDGEWQLVQKKKKREKKKKEVSVPSAQKPKAKHRGFSGNRRGVRLGGGGGCACVQLLLLYQRSFRDLRDTDPPP